MSATVTRLDDYRPSLLARAQRAVRAWWSGLTDLSEVDLPYGIAPTPRPARVQKPLNWPLARGGFFDEYMLDLARQRAMVLRTRAGQRVLLDKTAAPDTAPGDMPGRIELLNDCTGELEWRALTWMDDGAFAVLEHPWDLVSVETASCIHCDCHDIDMDYEMSWHFVFVDRTKGLGVCTRCAGGEAA